MSAGANTEFRQVTRAESPAEWLPTRCSLLDQEPEQPKLLESVIISVSLLSNLRRRSSCTYSQCHADSASHGPSMVSISSKTLREFVAWLFNPDSHGGRYFKDSVHPTTS